MRRISDFLNRFMYGRYGSDEFGIFLVAVVFVLSIVNSFIRSIVFSLVTTAIVVYAIFRMLSKNIPNRYRENVRFRKIFLSVTGFFKTRKKRISELRRFKYIKCPNCHATLRVKHIKGKHTVACPRCGIQFDKTIRFRGKNEK